MGLPHGKGSSVSLDTRTTSPSELALQRGEPVGGGAISDQQFPKDPGCQLPYWVLHLAAEMGTEVRKIRAETPEAAMLLWSLRRSDSILVAS